jgi:uncharacterized cupredoxin-like copper-binding protein
MTRNRLANAFVVLAFAGGIALAVAAIVADGVIAAPVRVEIHIRYSHFDPSHLQVPAGTPVTFVLVNDDPIDHEWIVGDDKVHQVHRTGTEAHHGARPTEVSIPAMSTVETTVTFGEPVTWQYICHLPGHEAYGMVGVVEAR